PHGRAHLDRFVAGGLGARDLSGQPPSRSTPDQELAEVSAADHEAGTDLESGTLNSEFGIRGAHSTFLIPNSRFPKMQLAEIVAVSRAVTTASGRLEKTGHLA